MLERIKYDTDFLKGYILISIISFALFNNYVKAQGKGSTIEGYIYNSTTQKGIPGVNVYLSETTLGDASDDDGYFKIENIPTGSYHLILSHIGYKSLNLEILIEGNEDLFFEQALTPNMNELDEVIITSKPDREWKRNLKRFEKFFIGETENGRKTEILNPEVLKFKSNMSILSAEADQELYIRNSSLGYEIVLDLTYFEWNFINDSGSTLYFCFFKELDPTDEEEYDIWQINRAKTYKYSPQKFFKSFVDNNYKSDYKITGGKIHPISIEEREKYKLFEEINRIYRFKISILGQDSKLQIKIDSENVFGDDKFGYISYNKSRNQTVDELFIDPNGNLQNPLDFILSGVWFDYRVADKLPLNYIYKQK